MGEWKQNIPTRYDAELFAFIVRESAWHKMTKSQYVREAMTIWKELVTAGKVSLLNLAAQQEQRNFSEQREQCEQCEQIEFPATAPIEGRAKPLTRITASKDSGARRREVGVSRRSGLVDRWAWCLPPFSGKVRPFKSTPYQEVA